MGTLDLDYTTPTAAWNAMGLSGILVWDPSDFIRRYSAAQNLARTGWMLRKQMPVVEDGDIEVLKHHLHVPLRSEMMSPHLLLPLQRQIWVDDVLAHIMADGPQGQREFLRTNPLCVSVDLHIVDGHHRWLSGMLLSAEVAVDEFGTGAGELLSRALTLNGRRNA